MMIISTVPAIHPPTIAPTSRLDLFVDVELVGMADARGKCVIFVDVVGPYKM